MDRFTKYMASFQQKVLERDPQGMVMSFLSNHDMDRIAGCFLYEEQSRMAANLYLLSSGSPVIYYGEEIGMRGSRGGANTDANRRLAMLWGDGDTIKNPVGSSYPSKNQIKTTVADQMADENSLYRYYCRLLSVRHRYPPSPVVTIRRSFAAKRPSADFWWNTSPKSSACSTMLPARPSPTI
jgi:glycosidase